MPTKYFRQAIHRQRQSLHHAVERQRRPVNKSLNIALSIIDPLDLNQEAGQVIFNVKDEPCQLETLSNTASLSLVSLRTAEPVARHLRLVITAGNFVYKVAELAVAQATVNQTQR